MSEGTKKFNDSTYLNSKMKYYMDIYAILIKITSQYMLYRKSFKTKLFSVADQEKEKSIRFFNDII